jgi:hypothetical protein
MDLNKTKGVFIDTGVGPKAKALAFKANVMTQNAS